MDTPVTENQDTQPVDIPTELLVLPLAGTVVYPLTVVPLGIVQESSVRLIDTALEEHGIVALTVRAEAASASDPSGTTMIGTAARIHRLLRLPDGGLRVAAEGLERIQITRIMGAEPFVRARIRLLPDRTQGEVSSVLVQQVAGYADELLGLLPGSAMDLRAQLRAETDPRRLSYLAAQAILFRRGVAERQNFLALRSARSRLQLLVDIAERELSQFRRLPNVRPAPTTAAVSVPAVAVHTPRLEAQQVSDTLFDLELADRIYAEEIIGMLGVRTQLLEYLAACELRRRQSLPSMLPEAPILCLVGPAGVGKSSLARASAHTLGRAWLRIPVDVAHTAGDTERLLAWHLAGWPEPPGVIEFDGLDRMGSDAALALASVLDAQYHPRPHSSQPVLGNAVLLGTARSWDAIHPALRERLWIVPVESLDQTERAMLIERIMVPEQCRIHGLTLEQLGFTAQDYVRLVEASADEPGMHATKHRIVQRCWAAAARRLAQMTGIEQ